MQILDELCNAENVSIWGRHHDERNCFAHIFLPIIQTQFNNSSTMTNYYIESYQITNTPDELFKMWILHV